MTKQYKTTLLKKVFQTEKATEHFRRHEASESHKKAVLKLQNLHSPTAIEQLSSDATKTREHEQKTAFDGVV